MTASRAGLVVFCAVLMLCAGCGRADDDRAVASVTERFLNAVQEHQGARACAQLSAQTADALAHDEGEGCEKAVVGLDVSPSSVRRTQVFGLSAKVDLADGHSTFMELTREGWRVAAAGCVPQPRDEPYRCEVEA